MYINIVLAYVMVQFFHSHLQEKYLMIYPIELSERPTDCRNRRTKRAIKSTDE